MTRLSTLALLFAVFAAGCAPAEAPAVDTAQAMADLRAADAAYREAVTSQDTETWLSFYAPGAVMYPPNSPALTTPDAIRTFADEVFATPGLAIVASTNVLEVGAGGDVGYTAGHAEVSMTGQDGNPVSEGGPDVHVWRKQADGTWKVVIDIWNSEMPLPMSDAGGN